MRGYWGDTLAATVLLSAFSLMSVAGVHCTSWHDHQRGGAALAENEQLKYEGSCLKTGAAMWGQPL